MNLKNKMPKQTLIFDASVIAENLGPGRGRSGIYFVAYNVLRELVKSNNFKISLYCRSASCKEFNKFIKENFGNGISVYFGNHFATALAAMNVWNTNLRKHRLNLTKLLLNVFVRKPIKFLGSIIKLPHFDIALSPMRIIPNNINATKKYIILHDAIPMLFPSYYPQMQSRKYWFYDLSKYIQTNHNCKYFAVSNSTKNDFIRLLNAKPDDITVTPLAAGDNFYPQTDQNKIAQIRQKYNIPNGKKYVFSLCTLEPRKNLIRAIKTFIEFIRKNEINDLVFVLGGGHWEEFIEKLQGEISDLGEYKDKIIRAGYVDDVDLSSLYSGAEWFVYTSQYEGFGLPPLEAMKCGCPVITSNNSSLPEVVDDAGITIDWDNDEQHINAYKKYYSDSKTRKDMAMRGLAHSKNFSWNKTVESMITEMKK